MEELRSALRHLIRRFARPDQSVRIEIHRDSDPDDADERLMAQERKQREIEARVKMLEKQGNPRGIGRE